MTAIDRDALAGLIGRKVDQHLPGLPMAAVQAFMRDTADAILAAVGAYDRDVLVTTLIYHWRTTANRCECGWGRVGASFPEHIADAYEQALQLGLRHDWKPGTETQPTWWCSRCGATRFAAPPEYGCEAVR